MSGSDPGDPGPRPHGLHHARRVGEGVTACGLPALGWPYFWDLPFGAQWDRCCRPCLDAIFYQ